MSNPISLTSATRSNLLSLQSTSSLIGVTQGRLATGQSVNSPLDNALSYFEARSLNNRASDLALVKNNIAQGINVITAATQGLTSIENVLNQMKALASSAAAAPDTTTVTALAGQFNQLYSQIDFLAADSSYNGLNQIKSGATTLTVTFNEAVQTAQQHNFQISGYDSSASGLAAATVKSGAVASGGGLATQSTSSWIDSTTSSANVANIDSALQAVDAALSQVRLNAQELGTNAAMLQIRSDFTTNLQNTLQSGAGDLVNADMNLESANLLSLQTRQQLGVISLSIANQSNQSILRLF